MRRSVPGEPPSAGRRAAPLTTAAYSPAEWDLLTDLPGRVLVAAASPGSGRPPRGVAAGLAGLDAVAAGRGFDSDLVRAVVSAIYARHDGAATRDERLTDVVDLLAACRAAVRVLRRRADPADSAAYRQWVESVAARVCRAGEAGSSPADRRFLDRLGGALDLR
ncbi:MULTISPECIES: hypothetical protein [Micromonospora]|uniref:Uncharacterized protein n=1 Tax=Micromonospora solifontis TaxID=2487138 RepID=A0ABX9WFP4_9ACTN|nr:MULTISPECIES: hypothetical protein [Micromonospora]NES14181.1 hypothetical protein [Micromonospora sp. PPF5-17B]NES38005.1 hypothetical protein [Micromonospora solifontis]NES55870.1 hypothetical protein [Micromonospora sp. PPF5-6]RNL97760.1 hypothetical protein EFE23_17870 [Micromonospora solifontis]